MGTSAAHGSTIISPSPFFKLYAADVGVAAPHNATLGVSLPAVTAKPVGTFEMNGYTGWDAIFYGAPTAKNFKYEVVYYYRLQPEGANPAFGPMWVPLQFCTSAVDNIFGAETGLNGQYVEDEAFFPDTLLDSVSGAYHAIGLRDLLGKLVTPGDTVVDAPEVVSVSNSGDASDSICMLHGRHCTADWVRIHPYAGTTSYTTINVLARRVP